MRCLNSCHLKFEESLPESLKSIRLGISLCPFIKGLAIDVVYTIFQVGNTQTHSGFTIRKGSQRYERENLHCKEHQFKYHDKPYVSCNVLWFCGSLVCILQLVDKCAPYIAFHLPVGNAVFH